MTPFYLEVCADLKWKVDDSLVAKMKAQNEAKLKVSSDYEVSNIDYATYALKKFIVKFKDI